MLSSLLLLAAVPAHSDVPEQTLFVELAVNGELRAGLIELRKDKEGLWIDRRLLQNAGIALNGSGEIELAHARGLTTRYDQATQRLHVDADPTLLPLRRHSTAPRLRARTAPGAGALLSYDFFAQRGRRAFSASLWTEQRLFGPLGIASNSGVLQSGRRGSRYVRFDTSLRYLDEDRAIAAVAGDFIGNALPWTTAVRMGGIQLSRSFRMRPDLITMPLPSFAGQAAVPSSVDLFVNGHRQGETQVAPGRFVLDDVPVVTGAGEARIVTRDAVGREIETRTPFYVTPELLRPGLVDFSIELGVLRRGFGLRSFGYGRGAASASLRAGVAESFTIEGHAEAAKGLRLAGIGAVWTPGLWGSLHGSLAGSRRDGSIGRQLTIGYVYASTRFSLGAEHAERSRGFADLASFDLANWRGATRRDRVSASWAVDKFGSIGAAYTDARTRDGFRLRAVTASLSLPVSGHISAFAAIDYDIGRRAAAAQVRLVVPFGRTVVTGGGGYQRGRGASAQVGIARAMLSQGGFAYQASAAWEDEGGVAGQGTATWRAEHAQIEAGVATRGGSTAAWGGVTGALALIDGAVFAANVMPDAFAVVSTGMPGVAVQFENQLMGHTDSRGHLFVPRVAPYHSSRFAVDVTRFEADVVADRHETTVAVREASGAIIRLPVRRVRNATLALLDARGAPLPPGTSVGFGDGAQATVGWDGVVLLQSRSGPINLTVQMGPTTCSASILVPDDAAHLTDLGEARCL